MSSDNHHDNHSAEPKEVSFRTPMILAFVTVLIILLAVSTCDKKHGCCEDEAKCEAAAETKHGDAHGTEHATEAHHEAAAEVHAAVADSVIATAHDTIAAPATVEAPAHH